MTPPEPFVREAGVAPGTGPAVVCLHSNASTSSQWRGLMDLLSPRRRVLAPDGWGAGSWAAMPEPRKPPIAASAKNVRRWAQALFTEPTPLAAFGALDMPVLYMVGGQSTASAHGVAKLLAPALPRVTQHRFDSLGHMGPVTDPEPVNRAIEDFLARL